MKKSDTENGGTSTYRGDGMPLKKGAQKKGSQKDSVEESAPVLQSCKDEIQKYVEGIAAGYAARRIRDEELYRNDGYEAITTFIEAELGIGTTQWYYLTKGADIHEILKENPGLVREHLSTAVKEVLLPKNISWTRPLQTHRKNKELVCKLWAAVLMNLENITRKKVKKVVSQVTSEKSENPADDREGDGRSSEEERDVERIGRKESREESREDDLTKGGVEENTSGEASQEEKEQPDGQESDEEESDSLLDDLNDGVAHGILRIADVIAEGQTAARAEIKTARSSFEGLSHRREPEFSEAPNLPNCITGSIDPIEDREILIAFPTEMLTPAMARKAVPVGVPQAQYAMGVPLSHFPNERPPIEEIQEFYRSKNRDFSFNSTNENVDWAAYTTNPICGCMHDCSYCYAWYQAEGMNRYKQGFQPTFFPGRLLGFSQMTPPEETGHPRDKNVFVGSMSDVFGQWVPDWMIQSILDAAEANEGFDYLFLTKFPQKLSRFDFPDNAWIGTTVDEKHRVSLAERHFSGVDAKVKWLSCEPLLENVAPKFDELSMFDCVVIGAQKAYGGETPEKQPKLDWVIDLYRKAREADCRVYFKENLDIPFPKELPEG